MRPQPIQVRAASALMLTPMTVAQLAQCLSANPQTVRKVLPDIAQKVGTPWRCTPNKAGGRVADLYAPKVPA